MSTVKTVKDRLGDLNLQISLNCFDRSPSRYATYETGEEPSTLSQRVKSAGRVRELTGRCSRLTLRAPSDVARKSDAEKAREMLEEYGLTPAFMHADLHLPQKKGLLDHRLMYGALSSPSAEIRVECINYAAAMMDLMRALGCRTYAIWIPDGTDTPGQNSIPVMMERILNGLGQIGLKLRKSENLILEFRPFDPYYCCTAVPDWGTAAWLCRETDPSYKVLLDSACLLPGESLDSVVTAMLHMDILGCIRLSDNRLSQGNLPPGSLNAGRLFQFFLNLLQAESNGLCKIPDLVLEIGTSTRVASPFERVLYSIENIEMAFARALLVNPDELSEVQSYPDPVKADRLLNDAFMADVRPVIRAWREEHELPPDPLEEYRK
ncbi:hypothetical protein GF402_03000 [Candidatus Fermentibacteria bacterium]|nr:hypothetical protein [Candidatus Fermentibacteria bacterium]